MTNFSTNQVMQFYALEGVTAEVKKYPLEDAVVVVFKEGNEERVSDKIQNVMWGKLTTADALKKEYKKITITLDPAVEDAEGANVIAGEDYVVRVSYPEVAGLGVEGWTTKTAVAHAKKGMVPQDIYDALAADLKVALGTDGVLEVSATGGLTISPADATKFYKRGVRPVVIPEFEVYTNLITVDGDETAWAVKAEGKNDKSVVNGYRLADMEYFAMGERGDQYRMMGYPDVIDTEYKIDPKKGYDVLVVHYAYKGANEGDYKSEKDLIIAGATGSLDALAAALARDTKATFTKVDAAETVITPAEAE